MGPSPLRDPGARNTRGYLATVGPVVGKEIVFTVVLMRETTDQVRSVKEALYTTEAGLKD